MERGELLKFARPRKSGLGFALLDQLPQPARTERNLAQLQMPGGEIERILDRLCKQCPDRNGARLTRALDAKRVQWRSGDRVGQLHARNVQRRRQEIIRERRIEELPFVIEHKLLVESIAETLRYPAMDLPGEDQRVDDCTAIMHDDISEDLQHTRFG